MNRSTLPQSGKIKKNWTLLLVSETGKTRRIKWLKSLVVVHLVLLVGAVAAAGAFYYLYQSESRENRRLRIALQSETPVSVAAAVGKFEPEPQEEKPTNSIAAPPQRMEDGDSPTQSDPVKALEIDPTRESPSFLVPASDTEEGPADSESPKPPRVAIEDFEYSDQDRKNIYVRYKIKNTASRSQPVSGHAVVVLEGDNRGKPKWLALPNVHLVSGIPTGEEEGQAFSIANYKFMKFRTEGLHDPDRFSKAWVYVFDEEEIGRAHV